MRYRLLSALVASAATVANAAPAATTTYDYIVVGSGPGGGPLAADLARAGYSTLLIEAGGDEGDNPTYADIGNFNEAANDETTRWDFWVKHSDDPTRDLKFLHNTWDTGDGTFYVGLDPPADAKLLGIQYPRAAVLGGCAMHNAGVCSLPADDDWDIIVKKTGDKSWAADNMRQYLKKIEKNEYRPAGEAAHGYNGERALFFLNLFSKYSMLGGVKRGKTHYRGWKKKMKANIANTPPPKAGSPPRWPTTRGPRTTASRAPRSSRRWHV